MNAAQLREAGLDDNEIREYLTRKHVELRAAGFSDAEIEAKYGPTPASPPEPPPFDIEKYFRKPDLSPPDFSGLEDGAFGFGTFGAGEQNNEDVILAEVLFDNFVKPWMAVGYTSAAAFNRAMAVFGQSLDSLAEYIENKTGMPRGGTFREAAKLYEQNREYWQKRADAVGVTFLQELVGEAVGGAVPGISEFLLNIPYAALLGAAKGAKEDEAAGSDLPTNEIGTAIVEAAKRGILGKVFHAIAPLKRYLQAPVMAGTFGAQAAFEGADEREIAKGIGTGLIYSAASPGGRYGLNEIRELNRKGLSEAERQYRAVQSSMAGDLRRQIEDAAIIESFLEGKRPSSETGQPQHLILTGGPAGGGKSTGLPADGRENFVEVSSDRMKAAIGKEREADKYHERSSEMAKELLDRAVSGGYDTIYDSQMTNYPLVAGKIEETLQRGGRVDVVFTNIDAETSVVRSEVREKTGESDRKVPRDVSLEGYNYSLPTFLELFKRYKGDERVNFILSDNNVDFRKRVIVFEQTGGKVKIHDRKLFDELMSIRYKETKNKDGEVRYERSEKLSASELDTASIKERQDTLLAHKGHRERSVSEEAGTGRSAESRREPEEVAPTRKAEEHESVPGGADRPEGDSLSMSPEPGFRRTPEPTGTVPDKPVSRSEIRQFLEEKLDIPIRTGRFIGKVLGIFKPRSEVVRTKYANDIEVIAHEVGHALHKFLWPETMTKKGLSAQPFQAFAHELNQIATRPKAGQDVTAEGWAEFVRLYITDAAQAQRRAPDFYNFFEAQLKLKAPEVREILLEAREKYQKFIEQPPLWRILSQISIGKKDKAPRSFDELYTMAIDDLHPLELAVKEMAQGRQIPASKDPYKLARLLRGWHGKAEAFLKHNPFSFGDYRDIPGAKSLKKILEPVRENLDEFRAYIVAKRALELADRKIETGIYRSDAEAIVNMYESRFRETHRELLEYQDLTLKYLLDAGLLTPEAYAKMKIWNRDYVPFYRVMENTKGQGTGVGLEGRNPVKLIRGSWRDIVDPLESIIKNTFLYINLAEKNAVGRALVDLERTNQGLGKFVEKIPTPMKKTTVTPEEISRYMEDLANKLGFEAKDLPADMFDALEIFRPSAFAPKDNVIQVWEGGKRSLYQVDPEIGRVFKALDRENTNLIVKLLSYPAQWLRAGATLTPEFIGRNPIRDQWSAFCYSKYGFVPGFDLVRGIFSMLKKDDAYWEFKKAGADHSMLVSLDRNYLQDNLGDLLQKYPIRNIIKNPINGLRMLSELGEMGTRLGEFKRGLSKEASRRDPEAAAVQAGAEATKGEMQEAGFSAREVTLDFARMGAKTKAANALIAFWNAQVQGTDRIVRAFQENPLGTTARVAASITLPSVLLAIANHDDPRYKEIPQWQKDLFWIIPTDKTIWRIPKPFELGILFGSVPERITHYILDQDPKAFDDLADTVLRAASPGVIPTFQVPFIENWANRSLFFDRNLVPRSREDLLPEYQYSDHTTETAKLLSSLVGRFPGLDQWKGAAPAYIENLVYGWSGGLGRYALQIADAGLKAAGAVEERFEKPSKTLADIPFIKAFIVRYPSAQAESIQTFYDNFDKALAVNKTIKVLMEKEQNPEAAAKLWQSSGMADLEGIRTALSNAHNTIDLIYRNPDMTGDEKRELIDQIYMQMIVMAQNGNKLAESFEKARKEEVDRQKTRGIVKERAPASVAQDRRTPPAPGPESRPVQF